MTLSTQTMTDEKRKALILEYFNTFDRGGIRSTGEPILSLFADDCMVWFPKWGLAKGVDEVGQMFADLGSTFEWIDHTTSHLNFVFSGGTTVAVEGLTRGRHRDGDWQAGRPQWGAGRFCNIFEIWDMKIQRLHIYLDPDYAGRDTDRYPWLARELSAAR